MPKTKLNRLVLNRAQRVRIRGGFLNGYIGEIVERCKGTDLFRIKMESGDLIEFFMHEFEKI